MPLRIVVGVTGASGAVYARGLLTGLSEAGADVHLIVSPLGRAVAASELGGEGKLVPSISPPARLTRSRHVDLFGAISSGSYKTDGMVICPASPAFYGGTVTLDTLINSVVGRLLDLLGIPNELAPRWTGPQGGPVQTPDDGA
jgi:3-polyprenyl-4-hydroxybenzoate decarboxylase